MEEVGIVNEVEKWAANHGGFSRHRFFRTSGSSGIEKWIALSEEALEWSARSVIRALEISRSDVLALALPEVHVGGFGLVKRAELSGARLARFFGKWNAEGYAEWCAAERVTISSLVPTQVHDLVSAQVRAGGSLRTIVVGGGVLDDELKEAARALGWPVVPSYGMTETSSQVATGDGLPLLPGWEAKVVEGQLALRGGGLLTAVVRREGEGYFAEDPKKDGWFLTNDLVELNGSCLRILGRADRLVKVLGELVNLEEVEKFWREKLGVEVVLMTQPDERRGVSLHLYYEGAEQELDRWNDELTGPERFESVQRVPQIPRSALGKIDRSALSF